jgi:hypothetical protein
MRLLHMSAISAAGSIVAMTAVCMIAAGCGSNTPSVSQIAKSGDCVDRAHHEAAVTVVRSLIARGKISRSEVGQRFSVLPESSYLDASGNLRSFDRCRMTRRLSWSTG